MQQFIKRKNDWPSGNMVTWRGIKRLSDMCIEFKLTNDKFMGN